MRGNDNYKESPPRLKSFGELCGGRDKSVVTKSRELWLVQDSHIRGRSLFGLFRRQFFKNFAGGCLYGVAGRLLNSRLELCLSNLVHLADGQWWRNCTAIFFGNLHPFFHHDFKICQCLFWCFTIGTTAGQSSSGCEVGPILFTPDDLNWILMVHGVRL